MTTPTKAENPSEEWVDALAEIIEDRIGSEFKGFWAPEDLVAEIPGMIREAAALLAQRSTTNG